VHRVGVIADTHCPEFTDRVPEAVSEAFSGVDLILHAGDVGGAGGTQTLRRLGEIAPVIAVRGDHDGALQELPLIRELWLDGHRIALVHGNHGHLYEEPTTFLNTISLGIAPPLLPGHARWLRCLFPGADLIVSGHTHVAHLDRGPGPMLFNPGAIYVVDRAAARRRLDRGPGWFEWSWLQVVRRRLDRPRPSVGLLELGRGTIQARLVDVSEP
jgi:putative phosphoesterase